MKKFAQIALSMIAIATLTACGGGGGGSDDKGEPEQITRISGTAAVGAPIVGGTVNIKCASGKTATVSTDAQGSWFADFKPADYPCAAQVSGGTISGVANTKALHTVSADGGVANITPITDLVVGSLYNQKPADVFASARTADLQQITSTGTFNAVGKVRVALTTLPGKPELPVGFNPISSVFQPVKGNEMDDMLEVYGTALKAANITQETAAVTAGAGQALTKKAYAAVAYTTPNLTGFKIGSSVNLDDTFAMALQDPGRGSYVGKAVIDADGNVTTMTSDSAFTGAISVLGNRIGQLCTADHVSVNNRNPSQYVYVSDELVEVTDFTELYGLQFRDYEDCDSFGGSSIDSNGNMSYTPDSTGIPNAPDGTVAQIFSSQGRVDGNALLKGKVYKYADTSGTTTYVYIIVSTKIGNAAPELNEDTDWVVMGISQ